jgi:hypothetical protein
MTNVNRVPTVNRNGVVFMTPAPAGAFRNH